MKKIDKKLSAKKTEKPIEEFKVEAKPVVLKAYGYNELSNLKSGENIQIIDGTKLEKIFIAYPIDGQGINVLADLKYLKKAYNLKEIMDLVLEIV